MIYCQFQMLIIDTVSTCFGHLYAHHQEKGPRVTAYGVFCWYCWTWLVAVLWCYVEGVSTVKVAAQQQPS